MRKEIETFAAAKDNGIERVTEEEEKNSGRAR
jgi:hypothetical protein